MFFRNKNDPRRCFLQVTTLPEELYPTDVHWFPKSIGAKKQPQSDIFVLTATDGTLKCAEQRDF